MLNGHNDFGIVESKLFGTPFGTVSPLSSHIIDKIQQQKNLKFILQKEQVVFTGTRLKKK